MNFTRGLDPKIAMNTGLRALEIVFIGYGKDQPHNKSMIERILNDLINLDWQDRFPNSLKVFYKEKNDHLNNIHTCHGWLSYKTIFEIKYNSDINYIKFNDKFFRVK